MGLIAQNPSVMIMAADNTIKCEHEENMEQKNWQSVAGQYLTDWQQRLLDKWVGDAFGYYAAQLGHTSRLSGLQNNRCSHRLMLEIGQTQPNHHLTDEIESLLVDDFTELPFETDSMDLLILPHTLDDHKDPHAVLREAYRVLRPEGKMIILGNNPFSLWGARAMVGRWLGKPWWAYQAQALHLHRLKDWLELLNCDITQGKFGCYAPYVKNAEWLARWRWLEAAGDRWWGVAGATYALTAVKRVYSPTLVGRINDKSRAKRWAAQPAINSVNQHKETDLI
jgi:SAM-dependent methyltransferase